MKNINLLLFTLLFTLLLIETSCKKDETKNGDKNIVSFILKEQDDSAFIDLNNKQVVIYVKHDANLKKLVPEIKISDKAKSSPASGDTVDFSKFPVNDTVTAEDGSTQIWKIYVIQTTILNLNDLSISSIVFDKLNARWIGTNSGLYKGIGNEYLLENLSISTNILSSFYEKKSDILWVGTTGGISKVNIAYSGFSSSDIASSDLSNANVRASFIDSSSRRWFGTNAGITLNTGEVWKKSKFIYNDQGNLVSMDIEKDNTNVNSIAAWDGDYYFATSTKGLYRAHGYNETVDAFTGATQWGSPYNGNAISDTMFVAFADSKGIIWLGGTAGLQTHTGHNSTMNNTEYTDVLPNIRVHSIAEAPDGKIWVGTENGITVFNGSTWTTLTTSLPNPFVTAIAFDKDGSAWVGTKKGLMNIK